MATASVSNRESIIVLVPPPLSLGMHIRLHRTAIGLPPDKQKGNSDLNRKTVSRVEQLAMPPESGYFPFHFSVFNYLWLFFFFFSLPVTFFVCIPVPRYYRSDRETPNERTKYETTAPFLKGDRYGFVTRRVKTTEFPFCSFRALWFWKKMSLWKLPRPRGRVPFTVTVCLSCFRRLTSAKCSSASTRTSRCRRTPTMPCSSTTTTSTVTTTIRRTCEFRRLPPPPDVRSRAGG